MATVESEVILLLCRRAPGWRVIVEGGLVAPTSEPEADCGEYKVSGQFLPERTVDIMRCLQDLRYCFCDGVYQVVGEPYQAG